MSRCERCRGLLRPDDGLLRCWTCGREADPSPVGLVDKWHGGPQPGPRPPLPRSGPRDAKAPPPSEVWVRTHTLRLSAAQLAQREAKRREMWRKQTLGPKATGKTHVVGRYGPDL